MVETNYRIYAYTSKSDHQPASAYWTLEGGMGSWGGWMREEDDGWMDEGGKGWMMDGGKDG